VAEHDGVIFVDLCNSAWDVVAITPEGWTIPDTVTVRFRRTPGMQPLPIPITGGSVDELREFINVDADGWVLAISWLVGTLRPERPFPILGIHGEQGSGKTLQARMLRRLVDPNTADLRSCPREEHDLVIAAKNGWIVGFDNVSTISEALSDSLCRVATGAGFGKRRLYTDTEEALIDVKRPILYTAISRPSVRSDLADREITINVPVIERYRTEDDLWLAFDAARPRILGALLSAVSIALRRLPTISMPSPPRMADFAVWATAAETAFGWTPHTFLSVYAENRSTAHELTLEASPLPIPLREFMADQNEWTGTAQELLEALVQRVEQDVKVRREWPRSARGLRSALARLAPDLRATGLNIKFGNREPTAERRRLVTITKLETVQNEGQPSTTVQRGASNNGHLDDVDGLDSQMPLSSEYQEPGADG
jgi:hypothetical protein